MEIAVGLTDIKAPVLGWTIIAFGVGGQIVGLWLMFGGVVPRFQRSQTTLYLPDGSRVPTRFDWRPMLAIALSGMVSILVIGSQWYSELGDCGR